MAAVLANPLPTLSFPSSSASGMAMASVTSNVVLTSCCDHSHRHAFYFSYFARSHYNKSRVSIEKCKSLSAIPRSLVHCESKVTLSTQFYLLDLVFVFKFCIHFWVVPDCLLIHKRTKSWFL
uniref:Uncharacterized protein n=1 Tax=Rhizophora mucronata TaxID=61149 RepID=A0A2P2K9R0_RHIMU